MALKRLYELKRLAKGEPTAVSPEAVQEADAA
jgi:hypothetical protein